jgi:hypothetical protein
MVRQRSFALKCRRKQQYKEIGRTGGVAEMVECLPSKCEVLPPTPKKNKQILRNLEGNDDEGHKISLYCQEHFCCDHPVLKVTVKGILLAGSV